MSFNKVVAVMLSVVVLLTASAVMAEEKPSATASVGVFNKYIFRGYELSKKSVVIQPAASVSYYGFSMGFWGNMDTAQQHTQSFNPVDPGGFGNPDPKDTKLNEVDWTLSYSKTFNIFTITGGWTYYGTDFANHTQELFLSLGLDVITKPTLSIYQDISEYKGTYYNLALSHSFNITKQITFDLGASAGYMVGSGNVWRKYNLNTGNYDGPKYKALHDGMVKAGMTIPVGKFSFQPTVQYWFPLSKDAKDKAPNGASINPMGHLDGNFVVGLTASLSF